MTTRLETGPFPRRAWCVDFGRRMGHLDSRQIAVAVVEGWLSAETRVWREGRPSWLPIRRVGELHDAVASYRRGGRGCLLRASSRCEGAAGPLHAVAGAAQGGAAGARLVRGGGSLRIVRAGGGVRPWRCRQPGAAEPRWASPRGGGSRWRRAALQLLLGLSLGVLVALGLLQVERRLELGSAPPEPVGLPARG